MTNVTPPYQPAQAQPASQVKSEQQPASETDKQELATKHPFQGLTVHIGGMIQGHGRKLYTFMLAQSGMVVSMQTNDDMQRAGYTITPISECAVKIEYPDVQPFFARCDLPKVGATMPSPAGT